MLASNILNITSSNIFTTTTITITTVVDFTPIFVFVFHVCVIANVYKLTLAIFYEKENNFELNTNLPEKQTTVYNISSMIFVFFSSSPTKKYTTGARALQNEHSLTMFLWINVREKFQKQISFLIHIF